MGTISCELSECPVTISAMRKLPRSLATVFVSLVTVFGLLGSTAPAQSLDLGPSSNYLIRVTPEAKAAIEKTLGQYGGKIDQRYQYVFDGFLVKLPDVAVVALKRLPNILIIEKDAPVEMSAIQNVRVAFTNGMLAVLAGIIPVIVCISLMPLLANKNQR